MVWVCGLDARLELIFSTTSIISVSLLFQLLHSLQRLPFVLDLATASFIAYRFRRYLSVVLSNDEFDFSS